MGSPCYLPWADRLHLHEEGKETHLGSKGRKEGSAWKMNRTAKEMPARQERSLVGLGE